MPVLLSLGRHHPHARYPLFADFLRLFSASLGSSAVPCGVVMSLFSSVLVRALSQHVHCRTAILRSSARVALGIAM